MKEFSFNLNLDIEYFNILIAFISAIIGIAYPLLLQVIERIDDKYSSIRLTENFKEERINKIFVCSLQCSLTSVALLILLSFFKIFSFFLVDKEAIASIVFIILFPTTTICIIYLFKYANLILTYYNPIDLIHHLSKKIKPNDYKRIQDNNNDIYDKKLKPIFDLVYYAIKSDDEELDKVVFSFLIDFVIEYRDENPNEIVYPEDFYTMIRKVNRLII